MQDGSTPVNKLDYLLLLFDFSVEFFGSAIIFSKSITKSNICTNLFFFSRPPSRYEKVVVFFHGPLNLPVNS